MFQDFRVVVVTPAGRRAYLECLFPHVLSLHRAGLVDEYQLWLNTSDTADIAYMKSLESAHPSFVIVRPLPPGVHPSGNDTIHHFFPACTDPSSIYVRFDDDVVQLDSASAFERLLQFRISHPEYFLVYGNILNNAVCSHILQRFGKLSTAPGIAGYDCTDRVGWNSPSFAESIHEQVRARGHDLSAFRIPGFWELFHNERVSINCISWLGSTFAHFSGRVGRDEEQWLSVDKPRSCGLRNAIFLEYVVVHYAFYTQRPHLSRVPAILSGYLENARGA